MLILISDSGIGDRYWIWMKYFFIQAEDGIRHSVASRGLGDVYKRQILLMLVGIILFFQHGDFINSIWSHFWNSGINVLIALIIIGVGVYLLYQERQKISTMFGLGAEMPLSLSDKDKQLAGVCGGIAKSISMDSTIIRFFLVYGTIMSVGIGLILYFILALVLPNKPAEVGQNG